jgi:hypothetical protein
MNSMFRVPVIAASFALVFCSAAQSAVAAGPCDRPTVGGEARACAARQEGPTALRRFILRTEMIYGLSYQDFQPAEAEKLAAQHPGPSVATRNSDVLAIASTGSAR